MKAKYIATFHILCQVCQCAVRKKKLWVTCTTLSGQAEPGSGVTKFIPHSRFLLIKQQTLFNLMNFYYCPPPRFLVLPPSLIHVVLLDVAAQQYMLFSLSHTLCTRYRPSFFCLAREFITIVSLRGFVATVVFHLQKENQKKILYIFSSDREML